jgi:TatA/E family protein of Tat protein translocase
MNLGMPEMIFIFLLALVIFGPRKLPELGKQLGKALAEFKKASNDFKNQLEVEMMNIELEERAKKSEVEQATAERTISPIERLFDTISGPPGAVSRGSLEPYNGPPITEPGAKEAIESAPEKPATNPTPQPAHDA